MSDQTPNNGDLINFIAAAVESMRDQMATKDDLAGLETRLEAKIEAETTAVRGDIERLHLRIDSIERMIRVRLDQMDAEIARLRSVLYLLVKDRPELLRLLGQPPSPGETHT